MMSFVYSFMGVVIVIAVFAILVKTCAGDTKRAEKWEKAEIIKQLVALSDRENNISATASSPARNLPLAPTFTKRNDKLRKRTNREHNSKLRCSPLSPNSPFPPSANPVDTEIEEQIRQRAYELYQERGGVDGSAADDWLQAREEVLGFKARASS